MIFLRVLFQSKIVLPKPSPREAREQKITLNVITYIMIPNCIHSAKKAPNLQINLDNPV